MNFIQRVRLILKFRRQLDMLNVIPIGVVLDLHR